MTPTRRRRTRGGRGSTPHSATIEDYQLLQTSREEYVLKRIRQEMCAADIPVEFSKGEAGRGQHEVNVTYAGSLETADRHLVFKNGIKEIAAQEGRAATFMAKWSMDDVGSSCHVHNSLWDATTDAPLMADPSHPSGLSTVGRRFLAGQLHAARQLAWCAAPTVNSYRRYVPGKLGAHRHRVGRGQPHLRLPASSVTGPGGASRPGCPGPTSIPTSWWPPASPPASTASTMSSTLPEPYRRQRLRSDRRARVSLPPWSRRSASWRDSAVAAEAFGPDVHHHLLNTAQQEWEASNRHVSDWELARNFERM